MLMPCFAEVAHVERENVCAEAREVVDVIRGQRLSISEVGHRHTKRVIDAVEARCNVVAVDFAIVTWQARAPGSRCRRRGFC
eukprot:10314076-Lingulodinium_polyedra.AAC.1